MFFEISWCREAPKSIILVLEYTKLLKLVLGELANDFQNLIFGNFGKCASHTFRNLSLSIFKFETLIAHLSKYFTLAKGDLIYTGTPAGVGQVKIGDKLEGFIGEEKMIECNIK